MKATRFTGVDDAKARLGQEIGVSDWMLVEQERVNAFAQVTGDRRLRRDRLDDALLHGRAALIERAIAGDDALGLVRVAGDERGHALPGRLGHGFEDADYLGVDGFEFLPELLAHVSSIPVRIWISDQYRRVVSWRTVGLLASIFVSSR